MPATAGDPWAFHAHPGGWAVVVAVVAVTAVARHRDRAPVPVSHPEQHEPRSEERRARPHRLAALVGGIATLAVALSWPVADLAAHWSLTALVAQRLLLVLGAAPLLLVGMPERLLVACTRPWPLDTIARTMTRPLPAVIGFSAISFATLVTPAVALQAHSGLGRAIIDALVLGAGVLLWAPVVRISPAAPRPGPLGRGVYLFVQSIVPGFPSIIFIFARHPLYPAFAHAHAAIGLSPLGDQELAGIVAKVATIPVLWSMAWRALSQAQHVDRSGEDPDPLTWSDVERDLQRIERAERRQHRADMRQDGANTRHGDTSGGLRETAS